jgi:hypothetical protein
MNKMPLLENDTHKKIAILFKKIKDNQGPKI